MKSAEGFFPADAGPGSGIETSVQNADLESLVEAFYPRILRAALVMTGSRHDAEDLAQETFLAAMRSWRQFAGRSGVHTWLYSILLNLHRRRLRAAGRRWRRWLRWFHRASATRRVDSPDGDLLQDEWRQSLWAAVARLPEPQSQAVVLRYSEGLSYPEIAEVLRCPLGTVKSRLHHGLAALERELGEEESTRVPPADARPPAKVTKR
ncbi:MAG: RNA polymerase sigma factor [Planctomycetota bacterium]|jgi:RNA polymerase sigma-70 factor (ECF subfamily)